jgi:hypothetical protein
MRTFAALTFLAPLILDAACGVRLGPTQPAPGLALERDLVLNRHRLSLHMHGADPRAAGARPLLVYATGDGGWSGKDLALYRALAASGDPIVGFDAHDYVRHLGTGLDATTTPGRLARDYQAIIASAGEALHLDRSARVILVGVSRGAGLSVVAAGAAALRPAVDGVLAIGLTKEEEYARWFRRISPFGERGPRSEMVELYDYLPQLGTMPVAVIQSTRDHYLPASAARALFGPDTPNRRFTAIAARNHSFAGARTELYQAVRASLVWMDAAISRR